jgi:hypothetical protein
LVESSEYSSQTTPIVRRVVWTVFGFAVVGSGVILALEHATRMKIQTGPLAAIIAGLIIAAAGVLWHLQTTRTSRPVIADAPQPASVPGSPPSQPQSTSVDHSGGRAPDAPTKPENAKAADATDKVAPPAEAARPPLPAYAAMSDAEIKSATAALAGTMRVFEQGYDARRYQFLDKQTESQQERDQQIQDLKTLQSEKVAEFTKQILPQAQALQEDLQQRLQRYGITDVAMPPPPAGTTMAMGRRLLQVDVTDVGLLGHQPVHGLAAYLELLASRLPG